MNKTYAIERSPLYKLRNKRKLAELMGLPKSFFRKHDEKFYRYGEFEQQKKNKVRVINPPNDGLMKALKKLNRLFTRIKPPIYLKSGVKGISYVDNASMHEGSTHVLTMDISDFYPSCNIIHLHRALVKWFEMENDVAWSIANLASYEGHIPQGAPTSQSFAYWSNKDLFDQLDEIALNYGCVFSLYVDDMTFSSNYAIDSKLIGDVKKILLRNGLKIKDKKTKMGGPNDFNKVTGVILDRDQLLKIPNKLRHEIIDEYKKLKTLNDKGIEKQTQMIIGKIQSARQIEPGVFKEIERKSIELRDEKFF